MPIIGAIIGGLIYRYLWSERATLPDIKGDQA
jgi:aquaporin Z